jgi:hypothetical protein
MTLLLTQMAIVLLITVACGWLALKVGQARVIGEIIAESSSDRRSLGASRRTSPPTSFPSVPSDRSKPSPPSAWCYSSS